MKEGVTATGEPYEPKPFVRIVPLDRRLNRRAGR
jgi:hypothetical protein